MSSLSLLSSVSAEKRLSRHYLNLDDSTAFGTLRYIDSDVESDGDDENANISAVSLVAICIC